jgi:hypothetical protein
MARSSLAITLPIVAVLLACGTEKSALPPGTMEEAGYGEPQSRSRASAPEMAGAVAGKTSVADDGSATAPVAIERKLIRTGSAGLEVKAVPEAVAQVKAWVEEAGGYVGDESESEDGYGV